MTVEDIDVVDIIFTDTNTNEVVLVISDHLKWSDTDNHLLILQEKINLYLSFIESGEIKEKHTIPDSSTFRIKVIHQYAPDDKAVKFYQEAGKIIEEIGINFHYELFSEDI